jgi:hypothetical protein
MPAGTGKQKTELPQWSGDHVAMLKWLDKKLNTKLGERGLEPWQELAAWEKLTPLEQAMLAASRGNVEPLRRYLIELTGDAGIGRFINLPKLKRGEHWKAKGNEKQKPLQPPEIAEWAALIREIWNEHYGSKQRRKTVNDWTAEEFAVALYMQENAVGDFDYTKREREIESDYTGPSWADRAADQNRRGKK